MRFIAFALFTLLAGSLRAEKIPDLADLSSPLYEKRSKAQETLATWVIANHAGAKDLLLQKYLKTDDPELRVRLVPLLERAYFKLKGFVGIVMSPEEKIPLGQVPRQQEFVGVGVRITEVYPGTPAEASGLKNDDVIMKINDWKVQGGYDLTALVAEQIQKHPPQTPISLQVIRNNKTISVKLKLGILPTPSQRARELPLTTINGTTYVHPEISKQMNEFRDWLQAEIDKEKKNLIADRRL